MEERQEDQTGLGRQTLEAQLCLLFESYMGSVDPQGERVGTQETGPRGSKVETCS